MRRTFTYICLTALLLAAGGCSFWPLHHKEAAAKPVRILRLNSTVVNLADPNSTAYLRVRVALGLESPPPAANSDADVQLESIANDTVIALASACTSAQLLDSPGKANLKHAIQARLNKEVPQAEISAVYFEDFLVQR